MFIVDNFNVPIVDSGNVSIVDSGNVSIVDSDNVSIISTMHIYNNIQFHSNLIIIVFLYALRNIDNFIFIMKFRA